MPQLDFFILGSQFLFVVIFFVCYLYFLRKILPYMTYLAKQRNKLICAYLAWGSENVIKKDRFKEKTFLSMLPCILLTKTYTHSRVYYDKPRDIFFGIYREDLVYITRRVR